MYSDGLIISITYQDSQSKFKRKSYLLVLHKKIQNNFQKHNKRKWLNYKLKKRRKKVIQKKHRMVVKKKRSNKNNQKNKNNNNNSNSQRSNSKISRKITHQIYQNQILEQVKLQMLRRILIVTNYIMKKQILEMEKLDKLLVVYKNSSLLKK